MTEPPDDFLLTNELLALLEDLPDDPVLVAETLGLRREEVDHLVKSGWCDPNDIEVVLSLSTALQVQEPGTLSTPSELQEIRAERKHRKWHSLALEPLLISPPDLKPLVSSLFTHENQDEVPLSWIQKRLWFLNRLEPQGIVYNVPAYVGLRAGGLPSPDEIRPKHGALQKALRAVIERHEILRTRVLISKGNPVGLVEMNPPFRLPLVDFSTLPLPDAHIAAEKLIARERRRPFNLETDNLCRFFLLYFPKETCTSFRTTLCAIFHRSVIDHRSLEIFLREVKILYAATETGCSSPLPPLPLRYGDFAEWQQRSLSSEKLHDLVRFWRGALEGAPEALELPTDRQRPPVPTYRGHRCEFHLSQATADLVEDLGRRVKSTPLVILLAAFDIFLARVTSQDDLMVGLSTGVLPESKAGQLIANLENPLIVRGHLDEGSTFSEFVGALQRVAVDAFLHSELPFERLLDEVDLQLDVSRNPLYQVMFLVLPPDTGIPSPVDNQGPHELATHLLSYDEDSASVDLAVGVRSDPRGYSGFIEYAIDLFDHTTAKRMARWYEQLVASLVEAPEFSISNSSFLSPPERHHIVHEKNDTAETFEGPHTLHGLFMASARFTPDAIAVVADDGTLSYRELALRANHLAARLGRAGVGQETLVGVCVSRSTHLLVAILGILGAGGAYVPLDPMLPRERLLFMMQAASLEVLVTEDQFLGTGILTGREQVILLGEANETDDRASDSLALSHLKPAGTTVDPDAVAYVLFTSGSTGRPKGVEISHRAAANFLCSMVEEPGLRSGETLLAVTTLSFDISVLEIFLPLTVSGRIVIAPTGIGRNSDDLAALVEDFQPHVMQSTPSLWSLLIASEWSGPPPSRVLCGGEPLTLDLARRLLAMEVEVWNLYGPTETTVWSSTLRVEALEEVGESVSLGSPIANTHFFVLDSLGRIQPEGVAGELVIGGTGLARGYLNQPGLTAQRFVPDPMSSNAGARIYRTGDLVRHRRDGHIEFLGRIDRQVKVRGFRIELGEIELALSENPAIATGVVAVQGGSSSPARLVAYLVPLEGEHPSPARLRSELGRLLPAYMIPDAFVFLDALPLTPNGKVDRAALPAPSHDRPEPDASYAPPGDSTEAAISNIWAEVLGIDKVGVQDHFFRLGGNSLLAIMIVSRLREQLDVELPLTTIYRTPTVAELAEFIRELEAGTSLQEQSLGNPSKTAHESTIN